MDGRTGGQYLILWEQDACGVTRLWRLPDSACGDFHDGRRLVVSGYKDATHVRIHDYMRCPPKILFEERSSRAKYAYLGLGG